MKFALRPGVRSPSFTTCAHKDETPGAENHEISVEAAAVSSFLLYSAVVTWAGPWGSHSSSSKAAQSCTQLAQSPSARALQLSHRGAGKRGCCCEAIKLVPTHEGEESEKLGLTFCNTHGLVQSRNRCAAKPKRQGGNRAWTRAGSVPAFLRRLCKPGLWLRLPGCLAF